MTKLKFLLLIGLIFIAGCTFNEPQVPTWDTEWTLHLPAKKWAMSDLIKGDSLLYADTTDAGIPIYTFSLEDSSDWQRIQQQDLAFGELEDHFNAEIGTITVDPGSSVKTDTINVMDLLPPELIAAGDTLPPYPGFNTSIPDQEIEFDDYQRVHIASGELWITFHNSMFLTIDTGLQIAIYDNSGSDTLIGSIDFDQPIPPGSTVDSKHLDLGAKTISNRLRLQFTIPIAGSDTAHVLTDEEKNGYFYTDVSLTQLSVDWAEAKIPAQSFNQTDSVSIATEDIHLQQAEISKGMIHIDLDNQLPLSAHVIVDLPDFYKDGTHMVLDKNIDAHSVQQIDIDLASWMIRNHRNPGDFIEAIYYTLDANADSSNGFTYISSKDYVSVNVTVDSMYFRSLSGQLDTINVDIDKTTVEDLDFFQDFDGDLRLEELTMTLTFENQIDFPVDANLRIAGYHENDQKVVTDSVIINLNDRIEQSSVSSTTRIVLNKNTTTPSIVDLLEILPTRLEVSGNAVVEGDGSIAVGQGIRAFFKVESPLAFEIKSDITQEVSVDTLTEEDIDPDTKKVLTEELQSAYLLINVKNQLPLGVGLDFYLAADHSALYDDAIPDSSRKYVLHGNIQAGEVGQDGYVSGATESVIKMKLSQTQLQIFNITPLYMRMVTTIPPTQGVIRVRQTDEIQVSPVVNIKYRIKTDE